MSTKIYFKDAASGVEKDIAEFCELTAIANIASAFPPENMQWKDGATLKNYFQKTNRYFAAYAPGYLYSKEASFGGKTLSSVFGSRYAVSAPGCRPWSTISKEFGSSSTLERQADGSVKYNGVEVFPASVQAKYCFALLQGGGGGGAGGTGSYDGGGGGAGATAIVCLDLSYNWYFRIGSAGESGGKKNNGTAGKATQLKLNDTNGALFLGVTGGAGGTLGEKNAKNASGGIFENYATHAGVIVCASAKGGYGGHGKDGNGWGISGEGSAGISTNYCPEGITLINHGKKNGGGGGRAGGGGASALAAGGKGGHNMDSSGWNGFPGSRGSGGGGGKYYATDGQRGTGANGGKGCVIFYY